MRTIKVNKVNNPIKYFDNKVNEKVNQGMDFKKIIKQDKEYKDKRCVNQSICKQLSNKYDINNATYAEFNVICDRLYETKQLTLAEKAILTFNPTISSQWENITKNIPNPKWFLTDADSFGKRDWIAELEARIEQKRRTCNFIGLDRMEKALKKLKHLERKDI